MSIKPVLRAGCRALLNLDGIEFSPSSLCLSAKMKHKKTSVLNLRRPAMTRMVFVIGSLYYSFR